MVPAVTILAMPPRIGPRRPLRVFLAEHREAEHLTQDQLGARFHPTVDKGTVSKWETKGRMGRLSTAIVAAYADALDKDFRDMFRLPAEGPSLDGIAAKLDRQAQTDLSDMVAILARRRAR